MAFYLKHPAGVSQDAEKMIVNLTCVVLITATMIQLIPSLLDTFSSPSFLVPCMIAMFCYRSVIMSPRTPPVNVNTEGQTSARREHDPGGDNGIDNGLTRSPNYIAEALAKVPSPNNFRAAYCGSTRDSWPLFICAYEAMCDEAGLSGEQKKAILLEFVHPDVQHLFIRAVQPVGEKPWSSWRLAIVRLMDEEDAHEENTSTTQSRRGRRRRRQERRDGQTTREPMNERVGNLNNALNNACGHCGPGHSEIPCRPLPRYQEAQQGEQHATEETHSVLLAMQAEADGESDGEGMPSLLEEEDDSDDELAEPISWTRATAGVDWEFVRQQLLLKLANAVHDTGGNSNRGYMLRTSRNEAGTSNTAEVHTGGDQGNESGNAATPAVNPSEPADEHGKEETTPTVEPTPCTGTYKAKASRGGDNQENEISHATSQGQGDELGQHPSKEKNGN